jgi:hypothetical protein
MKKFILILTLACFSAVGATAICKRVLADHTHSDLELKPSPTGVFDMGHSGGVDKNGGHYDRSTGVYHYH